MAITLLVGSMLLLTAMGMPLVFSMLGASVFTLMLFRPEVPLTLVAQLFVSGVQHYPLLALAFFLLAGDLMNCGGITQRIVAFANALVGHIRGGLAQVNVLSSMLFAGISGSAVADTAALGTVLIPAMKRVGYSGAFAAAVTQTSAVVGPIIPPSIPMIIFAFLAEVSVGRMFVAGIVPGVLVGVGLMGMAYAISARRAYPREDHLDWHQVARTGRRAVLALLAPVLIVGGVLGGFFTATEAGAVAVAYCFIVGRVAFKELSWADCWAALVRSAVGTATVLVLLGAATVFSWIAADFQISRIIADAMFAISAEPWAFLLMLNVVLLVIGLFLEPIPAMVIMVPIFFPIAQQLGIDPTHFGIIFVVNVLIGLCTPPVGVLIYMSSAIAQEPPERVVVESLPFLAVLVAVLLLVTYVPLITLALPNLFFT
jgi:tripartite ATP-independent transporter DctM subunit